MAKRIKKGDMKIYGAVFFVRICLLPAKTIPPLDISGGGNPT
jgi:hypothetical protein